MLAEPGSRCRCANQKDKKCLNFCQAGKDLWCVSCCYSLKGNACERMDCGALTHFGTCWANTLPKALPPTWVLTLLWYILWLGPERLLITCFEKWLMRCLTLQTADLAFFFNSSTFSLLTGLSPQWRKPHGTASKPAIALDPNAWTDSLLTARKWSGEFLLILL